MRHFGLLKSGLDDYSDKELSTRDSFMSIDRAGVDTIFGVFPSGRSALPVNGNICSITTCLNWLSRRSANEIFAYHPHA